MSTTVSGLELPATLMTGRPQGEPGELRNFVGGRFVPSERTFEKVSPVTGEVIWQVAEADSGTVDAAVSSA
ncbi:hypothetical protein ACFQ07_20545, partial [Actinomadura adrarensis]